MTLETGGQPEDFTAALMADDQVRLNWLREDLTSCLEEAGAILRRVSGGKEPPPDCRITIESDSRSWDSRSSDSRSADPGSDGSDPSAPPRLPSTLTWTSGDGFSLTYDWRTGRLDRRSGPNLPPDSPVDDAPDSNAPDHSPDVLTHPQRSDP